MLRRHLILLNIALCGIAVLLAWRFAAEWKSANRRYHSSAPARVVPAAFTPPNLAQAPPPPIANIIAKNLFSADRNNEIVKDDKSQPAPPVPIVFGTMNLGSSYEALMSESGPNARSGFRRVKNGEEMAGYKIVDIGDEKVVVEYRGEKTTINVYQSANSVPPLETRSMPAATPVVESVSAPQPQEAAQPAQQTNANPAPAAASVPAADPGLKVTVEGNRRRFERTTPFGPQVWYENIQK